jgi:hypothetical protein
MTPASALTKRCGYPQDDCIKQLLEGVTGERGQRLPLHLPPDAALNDVRGNG